MANGLFQIDEAARERLAKRKSAERRFRAYGLLALLTAGLLLCVLVTTVVVRGYSAFWQHEVLLDITFDAAKLDPKGTNDADVLRRSKLMKLVKTELRETFPEVKKRKQKRALNGFVSIGAEERLRALLVEQTSDGWVTRPDNPLGKTVPVWLLLDDDIDLVLKGMIDRDLPEKKRRVKDFQIEWIDKLQEDGRIRKTFAWGFFTRGDSREPELAGIGGAVRGSAMMLLVTLVVSFSIGLLAAVYLEEFAPKNRVTDFIEVNINNLAAVPSIVFGLLALSIFLNLLGGPRSAPLIGGLALSLLTLPTIIIAARTSIAAVPYSIREAAYGLGASKFQTVSHHVLPLAMPGILTGTIIGLAGALGESAPLLTIGMFAFIADPPMGLTDPSSALPVQIYFWFDSAERAFVPKYHAAIMVLLGFLVIMNGTAAVLRRFSEK